jgi:hypothetical protein
VGKGKSGHEMVTDSEKMTGGVEKGREKGNKAKK